MSSATITEVDELKAAYRLFGIEPLRVAPAHGPTDTIAVSRERLACTSSKLGFPTLTTATVPADCLWFAYVCATTPGTRWCETDLEPGAVMVWHPSAEHNATNQPGLELIVAKVDVDLVEEVADRVGLQIPSLLSGQVHALAGGSEGTAVVRRALSNYRAVAATGIVPGPVYDEDLALAATSLVTIGERNRRTGALRRIDSRSIVRACLDFADSVDRIPSISELCVAAHVSERRLRQAFTAEFDTPPSRFFRVWALAEARRRLRERQPSTDTVTGVALGLGFDHLGRFAGQYRHIYGEPPSTTLRSDNVRPRPM